MKFIALLFLMIQTQVFAQSYQITSAQATGSGCPQGSLSVTLSPDLQSISIIFDQFVVSARKGNNSPTGLRKNCRFTLGVNVPTGYNLEATTLQYRGFGLIPNGASGSLITSGPILQKSRFLGNSNMINYNIGALNDNFFVEHQILQDFKNTCQRQTKIEFDTTLVLSGKTNRFVQIFPEDTQLALDSIDSGPSGGSPIELGVKLSPCH